MHATPEMCVCGEKDEEMERGQGRGRERARARKRENTHTHTHAHTQVRVHHITEKDKFMVICSDGVWEFLSNEDVVGIVQVCV